MQQRDSGNMLGHRRYAVLVICSLSLFIVYVDSNGVNVALPVIQRSLHTSVSQLQWIMDAYLVILASSLVLFGTLGDRIGRRKLFLLGLLIFALGSAACASSSNIYMLIAFRAAQGVGGGMITPVSVSIVRQQFEDPSERARAFGIWSITFGVGIATGPLVGGGLASTLGWRFVFVANIPMALAVLALTFFIVPESKASQRKSMDVRGQILVIATLATLTTAIIEGRHLGWVSVPMVALYVMMAVFTTMLIWQEGRAADPLFDPSLLRQPEFAAANAVAFFSFVVLSGFLFINSLLLEDVRHYSAELVGVLLLPATVLMAASAPISGRIVAWIGPRMPLMVATAALAIGSLALTQFSVDGSETPLLVAYVMIGIAFGLINAPLTNIVVSKMAADRAGLAAAVLASARMAGNLFGVAVMGALIGAAGAGGVPGRAALVSGAQSAWWLSVGLSVMCLFLVVVAIGRAGTMQRLTGNV